MTSGRTFLNTCAVAVVVTALLGVAARAGDEAPGEASAPLRPEAQLLKQAQALFANRRFSAVVDICTRALQYDDRFAEAYHLRGKARVLVSPTAAAAAVDDFTAAIKNARSFAQAHFDRGLLYLEAGAVEPARTDFALAIREGMTGSDVTFYRGMANLRTNRLSEACDDFTEALRSEPELTSALVNRGIARYHLDLLKDALADFEKAIALDPRHARAYLNRGVVRLKRGDLDGAVSDFDETIEHANRSGDLSCVASSYFDRGKAFYVKKNYALAIADWERPVKSGIDRDCMTLDYLGLAYSQLQDETKAARCFEDAVQLDDTRTYAPAHLHLGAARYNQRDYEGAVKECTAAVEIDPTLADAYATRSLAFRSLARLDRARADQEQVALLRAGPPAGPKVADSRGR